MTAWENIFSEKGRVFTELHPEMEKVAKIFKESNVEKILDLGCGTGRHLVYLSKQGFKMYGFDESPKALTLAKEWLKEENLEANLVLHNMSKPFPYDDEFFDAIISIQVIHHNTLQVIKETVREISRTLKTGGYLFLTVPVKGKSKLDNWDLKEIENGTFIPQNGPEKGLPHHFFTPQRIKEIFNGFELQDLSIEETGHRKIFGRKM